MPDLPAYSAVGRVRRAHGLRGELAVELLTDAPDAIFAPGRRVFAGTAAGALWHDPETAATQELSVTAARPFKDGMLITFDAISDRTAADLWRGRYLLVPTAELEEPGEGEVRLHELEGMEMRDSGGSTLGVVRAWYQVPQGYILEVETPRGMRDVPFHAAFIQAVDRDTRSMVVAVPDGLLD